jgi:hypothetical protein
MQIYNGRIFLAASNYLHQNVYSGVRLKGTYTVVPEDSWVNPNLGFVGVVDIADDGGVAPSAIVRGPLIAIGSGG